ncbi:MAG: carboxypeptidase-like regulatory domain-containing protein [Myxococcota bacterium]|nr:carboxypeptidase-like regulatory domain-containing protein [Myxococcota bacterium]
MGHRALVLVPTVLLAALLTSCDGAAPTDAFELSGRVTALLESGEDGDGIADARVVFRSDTRIVSETTTDDSGRYRMRVLTDHEFGQVRAEADGFRPKEETVFFDSPQRRVDLQLRRVAGE